MVSVVVDVGVLCVMFGNLFDNVVKYMLDGGCIDVLLMCDVVGCVCV